MSKFCKLLKKLLLICLAFFAVTFAVYLFSIISMTRSTATSIFDICGHGRLKDAAK